MLTHSRLVFRPLTLALVCSLGLVACASRTGLNQEGAGATTPPPSTQISTIAQSGTSSGTPSGTALVAKGSFTAKDAKVPANAALPTEAYLTQVVRKSDGAIMDWGVTRYRT